MRAFEIINLNENKYFDKMHVFKDGRFLFYTAHYGSWANDKRIVFRVRYDTDPTTRAKEKDIKHYDRLLKSTDVEIIAWLNRHPKDKLISVEDIE
ncbi:hypothetical protein LCGC14_1682320 [marine sediment metagenome]|uniref:Uncharacterized protein n=1 Tax=marine sediment metagenome TaxID=412755 RepID=A0A0F9IAN2_9ZZZZ